MNDDGALPGEAIAVVGMACRFPGAPDVDTYWRNLAAGTESVVFFSRDELLAAGHPAELIDDPAYVPATGELAGSDLFDAGYFGLTPREAEVLDPQHRIFLECAVHGLEDANVRPGDTRIAVFGGAGMNNYLLQNVLGHPDVMAAVGSHQVVISNDKDYLASRVAYQLGLSGPAVSVQTACSTSLYAVHLACRTLLTFEADVAIAGGSTVGSPQRRGYTYVEGGIASPDGHCRAYDADAAGLPPGSGAGVVVLKRLEDAVADRDTVHGVILGSAINNDGAAKVGFTAPSVSRQADVIMEAHEIAQVRARSIGYVEGHGTATPLGDPVELSALAKAFARTSDGAAGFCGLGSVKSNFGHLDAAAGIAGLIKAVLSVRHGKIVPSLHFRRPNPHFDLESSPFYVATALSDWPADLTVRRAGVSSFGLGGTNAHVVLQQPPDPGPTDPAEGPQLVVLSARSPAALTQLRQRTADLVESGAVADTADRADLAYTSRHGRQLHPFRWTSVSDSPTRLVDALRRDVERVAEASSRSDRPLVLCFPGAGAVGTDLATGLRRRSGAFAEGLQLISDELQDDLDLALTDLLVPADADREQAARTLGRPLVAACATFALEYAGLRLLESWGLSPAAVLGHSLGEHMAAVVAGVLGLADAARLTVVRYRLLERARPGRMLQLDASAERAQELLTGRLTVAADNAPGSCVVSGPSEEITELVQRCEREGVDLVELPITVAPHGPLLDPLLGEWEEAVGAVDQGNPGVPWVSTLTGGWIDQGRPLPPDYWRRQLRDPVRFRTAMTTLAEIEPVLLEVGPGAALTGLAGVQAKPLPGVPLLPRRRPGTAEEAALEAAAALCRAGMDAPAVHGAERRRRVPLPGYPFQRESFWLPAAPARGAAAPPDPDGLRLTTPRWHQLADRPTEDGPPHEAADGSEVWVLVVPPGGFGHALAAALATDGAEVVTVGVGERFAEQDGSFTIGRDDAGDVDHVVRALRDRDRGPIRLVDALRAGPSVDEELTSAAPGVTERLVDALRSTDREFTVTVLTRGDCDLLGERPEDPATAWSAAAAATLPAVRIDLDLRADAEDPAAAVAELRASRGPATDAMDGPVIARRGRSRWRQTWETLTDRPPTDVAHVVVTGLGPAVDLSSVARLLDDLGARVTVLESSSAASALRELLPDSAEVAWSQADGPDGLSAALGGITDVDCLVDVSCCRDLESLAAVQTHLVALGRAGVVLTDDVRGVLLSRSPTGLAARVEAERAARTVLQQADRPGRWLVVEQPADASQAVTLAELLARLPAVRGHERVRLQRSRADRRAESEAAGAPDGSGEDLAVGGRSAASRQLTNDYVAPRSDVETRLAALWTAALGIEPIGVEDNFFALGGHSMLGTQLVAQVRTAFGIDFPMRELFDAATVAEMAERVVAHQAESLGSEELEELLAAVESGDGPLNGSTTAGEVPREVVQADD